MQIQSCSFLSLTVVMTGQSEQGLKGRIGHTDVPFSHFKTIGMCVNRSVGEGGVTQKKSITASCDLFRHKRGDDGTT